MMPDTRALLACISLFLVIGLGVNARNMWRNKQRQALFVFGLFLVWALHSLWRGS